jgi:hypothetical protein
MNSVEINGKGCAGRIDTVQPHHNNSVCQTGGDKLHCESLLASLKEMSVKYMHGVGSGRVESVMRA